jgi:hypothetical protein
MRLWSLHPSYLDAIGLVACWREGLLARKVLLGQTTGYRNHPQLLRFKTQTDPIAALDQYLSAVLEQANQCGYTFNPAKIKHHTSHFRIPITVGQLEYELNHLKAKLIQRDMAQYEKVTQITTPLPNPIFILVKGGPEPWEIILPLKTNVLRKVGS